MDPINYSNKPDKITFYISDDRSTSTRQHIFSEIFTYLTLPEVVEASLVSKTWYICSRQSAGEKINFLAAQIYNNPKESHDTEKAFRYFSKSADMKYMPAHYNLGLFYDLGLGMDCNKVMALAHYLLAANAGLAEACVSAASFYSAGKIVEIDEIKARLYLEKAAEQGHPLALRKLNEMYDKCQGVPQNPAEALEDAGSLKAMANLSVKYYYGQGVPKNWEKALELALKSQDEETGNAMGLLGFMYLNGHGVPVDLKRAFDFFFQCANKNNPSGIYQLGHMYFYGYGCDKDYTQARAQFTRAAVEYNFTSAYTALGQMLFWGEGGPEDKYLGFQYMQKAADAGDESAIEFLKRVT